MKKSKTVSLLRERCGSWEHKFVDPKDATETTILEQVERFLGGNFEVVGEADESQKIEVSCTYSRISGDVDVILVFKWRGRSRIRKLGSDVEIEYGKFATVCPLDGVSGISEVVVHVVVFPWLD